MNSYEFSVSGYQRRKDLSFSAHFGLGFMIVLQFEALVEFKPAEGSILHSLIVICNSRLGALAWPWTSPSSLVSSPASSSRPLPLGRNAPALPQSDQSV